MAQRQNAVGENQTDLPTSFRNSDGVMLEMLNRSIRPWTLPESPRDKAIEQALARQIIRRGLSEISRSQPMALNGVDLVIGGPIFVLGT